MMPHANGIACMIKTRVVGLRKDDEQKQKTTNAFFEVKNEGIARVRSSKMQALFASFCFEILVEQMKPE